MSYIKAVKLWPDIGHYFLSSEKLSRIRAHLLSNKSSKTRRKLTMICLKKVDWTFNITIFNHFTEKLKFCKSLWHCEFQHNWSNNALFIVLQTNTDSTALPVVERHVLLFWPRRFQFCETKRNEKKHQRKEKYNFCSESESCVMYTNNLLAVLILCEQVQFLRT